MTKFKLGFTLIELLVVVAIVGVLMAYATANFLIAQRQARDTRRQQDMEAVQTSMETYFAQYGEYPNTDPELLVAFESSSKPTDPKPSDYSYNWNWLDTDSYCICATMETKVGNANGGTKDGCNWTATGNLFCIQNRQ